MSKSNDQTTRNRFAVRGMGLGACPAVTTWAAVAAIAGFGAGLHVLAIRLVNPVVGHRELWNVHLFLVGVLTVIWVALALVVVVGCLWAGRRYGLRRSWLAVVGFWVPVGVAGLIAWSLVLDAPLARFMATSIPAFPLWPWVVVVLGSIAAMAAFVFWWRRGRETAAHPRATVLLGAAGVGFWAVVAALPVWNLPGSPEGRLELEAATEPLPFQVRMLALDGADWPLIDTLIDRGKLENFAKLRASGATATLETIRAPSPVIWASIATGYPPERHGVTAFYEYYLPAVDVRFPISVANPLKLLPLPASQAQIRRIHYEHWLARPIWEILDEAHRASAVFHWLFTQPPRPLAHGVLVPDNGRSVDDTCRVLMDAGMRGRTQTQIELACNRQQAGPPLGPLIRRPWGLTVRDWRIFLTLSPTVDFAAYFHNYIDGAKHAWHDRWVEADSEATPEVQEAWRGVIEAYRFADWQLGDLMDAAGPNDLVLVVSDHGWAYDERGHTFSPPGIFGLWRAGEGLADLRLPEPLDIFHVAPLLARLLAVPVAADWPGLPGADRIAAQLSVSLETNIVASYADRVPAEIDHDPEASERYLEMLRTLGYMQ